MVATKLFLEPKFGLVDRGDGGIRRVVEAQRRYLPNYGIEIVDDIELCDVAAYHAGSYIDPPLPEIPVVAHCHGLYWAEYDWENWALRLNKDVIANLRRANVVTAPSNWVADALRRGMWLEPEVLYHGIEPDDWAQQTQAENEGYILWNKTRIDPICEVDSLNKLAAMAPSVKFRSTFGQAGLPNLEVTDVLPYNYAVEQVRHAGIYLCTTRETFGIGTLEAMACGIPILGWAWGGQQEIVQHKEDGWLARPGDFNGLLEGLEYCLANRDKLGASAREHALANFTWPAAISRYSLLYSNIAKGSEGPKVSIIIPMYNLGHYLKDCLDSISRQTFKDYEIIIVDDCSTDGSGRMASSLVQANLQAKVITTPHNLYLAGALNYGIDAARGKYIIPLDADNMLGDVNTLQVLSEALDADRDLHIAYGAMRTINPDGSIHPLPGIADGVSTWPPTDFSFTFQMMHRNQCPSTSMYRREVWSRSGGYRRRCRTAEDADFWCRVTSLGFKPHKVTDAVTLVYRVMPDSMSATNADWDWPAWYPWSHNAELTPMGVSNDDYTKIRVPSYEPPLVSVVIPVGPNHQDVVIDAVDSVVAQDFQKWEVIVVNDSDVDLPWIHPFVKVLRTPKAGSGPAVARNLGIKASRGGTFLLLDADDILQPNAMSEMYSAWLAAEGSVYIYGDWVEQENGTVHYAPEYNCKEILQSLPHAVTALYPKEAWIKTGGIDESLVGWEDWDFVLAINAEGYCGIHIPVTTFQYRVRGGSRREELYAQRDTLKQEIYTKWREYIDGGRSFMGCSSCGGGFIPASQQVFSAGNGLGVSPDSDMTLVEFIASGYGDMTYRGQVTNTQYRFGSDADHKVGYVYNQDLPHLLSMVEEFQLFKGKPANEEALLVAPGPPQ